METSDLQPIGFLGTGVMGAPIVGHLLGAGHRVLVYNRTREKAAPLLEAGAEWRNGPAELARESGALFTMLGYPEDVRSVYLGGAGLLENARDGSLCIDLTTSEPELAEELAETGAARGIAVLDAPVSGGDKGARAGALSIMVGGNKKAFERAAPLLGLFGSTVRLQGPPGAGQHTKMCNQIAIGGIMMGLCESLRYAEATGLDPANVRESIRGGAAGSWAMENLLPEILRGNDAPGFYVKHFIKDLDIALRSARRQNLDLPGLDLALKLYRELADLGHADSGTQALIHRYRGNG